MEKLNQDCVKEKEVSGSTMAKVVFENIGSVVSKISANEVCVRTINLELKMNPNLDINTLPKIVFNSRLVAARVLRQILDGEMSFDDLVNNAPIV